MANWRTWQNCNFSNGKAVISPMNPNKDERDNRSNQLNPNNEAYRSSRILRDGNDDDDAPPEKSTYISGASMDYCRRLQEAQRRAIARGEPLPISVPAFE